MDVNLTSGNKDKEMSTTDPMVLTKPSVVSPVKEHGKITLGFRGFKIVNSNIKLVKQVDVKTSVLKRKSSSDGGPSLSAALHHENSNSVKKVSTADALKQIREKIQLRKKLREESNDNLEKKEPLNKKADPIENGICEKNSEKSATTTFSSGEQCIEKYSSMDDAEKNGCKISSEYSPKKLSEKRNEKTSAKQVIEKDHEKSKDKISATTYADKDKSRTHKEPSSAKHSSSKVDGKHREEYSSSSRHSYKHYDSRKSRERSRSPYRDKESSNKGITYSSSRSHRSVHHSRRREKTYARKYSASSDSREGNNSKSDSRSHKHQSDKRRLSDEDSKHHRRSSNHHQQSLEQATSPKKLSESATTSTLVSDIATEKKDLDLSSSLSKKISDSSSPQVSSVKKEMKLLVAVEQNHHEGQQECTNDEEGIFSKLSNAFSLRDDSQKQENEQETSFIDTSIKDAVTTRSLSLSPVATTEEDEKCVGWLNPHENVQPETADAQDKSIDSLEKNPTSPKGDKNDFQSSIHVEDIENCERIISETPSQRSFQESPENADVKVLKPHQSTPTQSDETTEHKKLDNNSTPTEDSLSPHSPPVSEELSAKCSSEGNFSSGNKIPTLASKLKNVFESLLQTDFKTCDVEKASDFAKLNGVILPKKTELPEDKYSGDVVDPNKQAAESQEEKATLNDTQNIGQKASSGYDLSQEQNDAPEANATVTVNKISCLSIPQASPDKACRVSPHNYKLKLHETTKTPLPAKKSYIRQVQSSPEIAVSSMHEAELFSLATKMMPESDNETGRLSAASDAETVDNTLNKEAERQPAEEDTSKKQPHCEQNYVALDMQSAPEGQVLPRQDSSGSSTNDADDGPRRSARIRTKKSEKILKKQLSGVDNYQVQNFEPTTEEVAEQASDCNSAIKVEPVRLPKDLSKEEIFKAKICLAPDVTDFPEPFELLEENLYLTSMRKSRARKEIRRMVCECALEENPDPDGPCGGNCLNRLLMIECSSRCLYGDKCTNKRFQHRKYAPTEVFKTNFKGWGIRAAADIKPGQLVMEYCGEVVDQHDFTRRSMEYSKSNHAHFYFMALSQDEFIDATYKGNSSRFINHSCDPNAETQKWTVNGRLRVGFFTLRDIEKGEEITFDYQFERYGKVAQKCFCGTAKCRGYLGKAPDKDDENDNKVSRLLSNQALSPDDDTISGNDTHKERKNKKLTLFRDTTMEKDISKLLGGLRSSKEVLTLSRLMVRCDTHAQRVMCLRVLKETTSQTRLKTFLQFHGLSIIWSWMVDISWMEDNDASALKLEIINTLCILPITNKNIIEDSKVLSVVQRWAKPETDDKTSPDEGDPKEEKKESGAMDGDCEKNELDLTTKEQTSVSVPTADEKDAMKTEETPKIPSSDEDTVDAEITEAAKSNENILTAAASLLDSWKDLREIYRIPKRQKPLTSPSQESNSRDNSVSRTSSPLPKQSRSEESEHKPGRLGRSRRESSQERYRDGSDRSWDKYRDRRSDYADNQFSPGSSNSGDNKKESGRRKRRFSTDSDEYSQGSAHVPWHCRPPRNSLKMSRQEHRRKFEKDVEKREQEKKRREEGQMGVEIAQNVTFAVNNQQFPGMVDEMQPLMSQDLSAVGHTVQGATFTASGYSGNLIQINPTQHAQLMADPYLNLGMGQQISIVPQVLPQTQNNYTVQMPVQPSYDMTGMYTQDPNLQMDISNSYAIADTNQISQTVVSNAVQSQQTLQIQQQQTATIQQQTANNVTILGEQNGQAIVLLSAEQLQKLTQGNLSALASSQPETSNADAATTTGTKKKETRPERSSTETNKDTTSKKLPPNWKTATDPEGRIYYYHVISRQTQWDPPTWDGKEEDTVSKKEAEMDLSSTPTHDERRLKTSKNKSDVITDEGRKAKEAFRLKMSQFVVQCLSSFRKPDRKVGRITSTEDFKHLARKLTHNIMQKEIKQVRVWEDLDFNANVKHKTKEYVKKYMSRVGPVYRIRDDNFKDPY